VEELARGVEMARYVKSLANYFCHPIRRPQFGAVPTGDGSLQQDPDQAALLPLRQSSRTTWGESHLEGLVATTLPFIAPTHHGTGRATDAPRNFIQGQLLTQKLQGSPASIGKEVRRTLRSHLSLQSSRGPLLHYFM
jgi:hypothetical protein